MTKRKIIALVGVAAVIVVIAYAMFAERSVAPSGQEPGSLSGMQGSSASSSAPSAASGTVATSSRGGATITIDRFYGGSSFTFSYPMSWSVLTVAPLAITNFNGKYASGNVIPPGGAEIDVVTTTVYGNLQSIMETELMGAQDLKMSTTSVDGTACAEAQYQDAHGGSATSASIALYCERNTKLWKIYLAYRANDPATAALLNDFKEVLNTLKFIP